MYLPFLSVVRKTLSICILCVLILVGWITVAEARGPYDDWNENGISYDDPRIVSWATGYLDYYHPSDSGGAFQANPDEENTLFNAFTGIPDSANNEPTNHFVSLGNGGYVTLTFGSAISNHGGPDFAIWENGFPDYSFREPFGEFFLAELMFVEVATEYHADDDNYWARFPTSYTESEYQTGEAGKIFDWSNPGVTPPQWNTIDATYLDGFAGKHANNGTLNWGTSFDLDSLADNPNVLAGYVDLDNINYVRVVDVIGDGTTFDSEANPIYDPSPSLFSTGGADLKGVAVLVPELPNIILMLLGLIFIAVFFSRSPHAVMGNKNLSKVRESAKMMMNVI